MLSYRISEPFIFKILKKKFSKTKYYFSLLFSIIYTSIGASPGGTSGKESACQCRRPKRLGFHPRVRKIPWRRKWQPLQDSCLENSIDRGAWWAIVHKVAESQTQLSTYFLLTPLSHIQSTALRQ